MDYRTDLYRAVTTALMTIVGASLLAPAGRADLIYFRKGGNAQIPVRTDGNRVFLAMPDGDISLPRELIMKRVPGFWPAAGMDRAATEGTRRGVRCSLRGGLVGD